MRYLFPILSFLFFLSSCTEHLVEDCENITVPFNETAVNEGIVRVKLTPQAARSVNSPSETESDMVYTGIDDLDRIARQIGATRIERSFADGGENEWKAVEAGLNLWYDIYFDEDISVSRAYADLSMLEDIALVEPDYKIKCIDNARFIPFDEDSYSVSLGRSTEYPVNDPYLNMQWNYHNTGSFDGSVAGADINLFEAWNVTAGDPDVIVAVVDGGIDFEHDDLKDNMWHDDQGHCGWNFVDNNSTIVPHTHGTHVAGTIAAVNNNGIGVSGVAGGTGNGDGIRLMSCQIYKPDPHDPDNDISSSRVHEAIRYGADHGAVISQNSWGYVWQNQSQPPASLSQIHKDAIDYFIRYAGTDAMGNQSGPMKGGIVIFAAGNYDSGYEFYPAAYNKVVSVSSFAADFQKASYSNYGSWVTLSAPGGDYEKGGVSQYLQGMHMVLSTVPDNEYAWSDGTSMACPHVSGIAALVISYFGGPGFTPDLLRERLVGSCNDIERYQTQTYKGKKGAGYIYAALAMIINKVKQTET